MAHFAKIVNNIVTDVIVAEKDFIDTQEGTWVQTSYNTYGGVHHDADGNPDDGTPLRANYAGIGYIYNSESDVFHAPQPHASWTLGSNSWIWNSPIPYPEDDKLYVWDEDVYQADNTKGWVVFNGE